MAELNQNRSNTEEPRKTVQQIQHPLPPQAFIPFFAEIVFPKHNWLIKLIWVAILSLFLGGFLYTFVNLVKYYLSEPMSTSVYTKNVESLALPDVGICMADPLNVTRMLEQGYTQEEISKVSSWLMFDDYNAMGIESDYEIVKTKMRLLSPSWESFIVKNGPQCENLFIKCMDAKTGFPCCEKAVAVQHDSYGTCFHLKGAIQYRPGPLNGMTITAASMKPRLDIGSNASVKNGSLFSLSSGLVIELALEYKAPRTANVREQIFIPPNKKAYISLSMVKYRKDSSKTRPCMTSELDQEYNQVQKFLTLASRNLTPNENRSNIWHVI